MLCTVTMQAVKDWRTNLAGDELMPSSSHINFVRIVSQVENIGSEAGIMSYFFRLNGLKCQEWKPRHLCDWNTPWWAMCIAHPAEICSMQSWSVGPNLLFKFIRVIMYSLYLYCIHSVAQILFFFLMELLFISVYNLFLPMGKLLIFYTILTNQSRTNYDILLYNSIWQKLPRVNIKKNSLGRKTISLCYNWVEIS